MKRRHAINLRSNIVMFFFNFLFFSFSFPSYTFHFKVHIFSANIFFSPFFLVSILVYFGVSSDAPSTFHSTIHRCHDTIDFLPFTCDLCKHTFCHDHRTYEKHACPLSKTKDVRYPSCPICQAEIPIVVGQDPNTNMDQHIQSGCLQMKFSSTPAPIIKHKCGFSQCKQKEFVQFICRDCNINYCTKHRHSTDHHCKVPPNSCKAQSQLNTREQSKTSTFVADTKKYPVQRKIS
eukprot:TRINITY_DN11315_c0_g1_i1.p1 TRINITY_DN11315_c0_g1~~TRINITY_DN11315_c0_g1_i1.p1  ORF type:complete len:234 (-),score=32.30 TRINITY_DN11315_c0_g1_i1:186-887(-)